MTRLGAAAVVGLLACNALGCVRLYGNEDCQDSHGRRSCVVASRDPREIDSVNPPAARDEDAGSDDDAGSERDAQAAVDSTRWLLDGVLVNARDLGGVRAGEGAHVAYDQLFRGPPLVLSEDACDEYAALGIRTIIDLRIPEERDLTPDAPCATDISNVVLAPLPVPYNVSPTDYLADLDASESIVAAFAALGDAESYPVYFHCTWGRDRTGVLGAVILLALGVSRDDVMQEYLLSKSTVGAYPLSLTAVLDEIEARGGIERYLEQSGVSKQALATLRARARAL